ncbi:MAG: DUF4386 domain-containing protein [Usitatibacteraceae bacterium]
MTNRTVENSPQWYARACGLVYLAIILFGGFAEGYVMDSVVVSGNHAATARNIAASPALWHASLVANLLVPILAVGSMWFMYLLLRPVNKQLILLSVFLTLVSLSVEAVSKLFLILVVPILSSPNYLQAFEPQQLHAFANLALASHNIGFNIALIFFGCACLVDGYLILKSGYFPKLIGLLMQLAGVSYLVGCFAALFAPAVSALISPAVLVPALIGESSFCLWLLVRGVDVAKWSARIDLERVGA